MWTSLILPTAVESRAVDACDWTQYFFMFDNVCSGAGHLARRTHLARELFRTIEAVMRGDDVVVSSPYAAAFEETWRRIVSPMPRGQRERFAASVGCFLDGCFSEITSRAAGRVLDYETYMCTRRNSVGGKMYFLLAEHGLRIDLTDDLTGPLPGDGPLGDLIATALDMLRWSMLRWPGRARCRRVPPGPASGRCPGRSR